MSDPAAPWAIDYLEGLMEGFVAYDADWRMTYMNASGERLLGRRREEVLGKTWHEAFPHAVGNPVDLMYQRVKRSRVAERMEYCYAHYGNAWMEIAASPIGDGGVGVYFRDISDRRHAEVALQESARRKDEFIAVLAHELRNPLAPITSSVELLELQGSMEPGQREALAVIRRQLGVMARLIDDLLDTSRISSGKLELRRERVELAAVVERALETSRPHLRGRELVLALPAAPVWLDADPVRLAQVLANLLQNACKYSPDNGKVRLSAAREGAQVAIRVSDAGIGIEPQHMARLFEMFSQAAPARERAQGGLGIGLALSRALVEMHGGTIAAASEGAGRGSEFTVTLPALEALHAAPRAAPPAAAAALRRVLVVDDNEDAATALAMLLRAEGHTVEVANDGARALAAAAAFRPSAVLLDIGMPGMNGFDTCRALRAQAGGESILIAALTGWGQEEDRSSSVAAGFDAHIVKPAAREALAAFFASTGSTSRAR